MKTVKNNDSRQSSLVLVVLCFFLTGSFGALNINPESWTTIFQNKGKPAPGNMVGPPATAQIRSFTGNSFEGDVKFAVIGDYGIGNSNEAEVANLVQSWSPDFVITTGDNNYPDGEASTIDQNIGQFYSQYIGNYQGSYGAGSAQNRFWPSLGNHDWHTISCGTTCSGAYFDYFTLPGNERYYSVDYGLVRLFIIDSDPAEPDGIGAGSDQAAWLQDVLAVSEACYNVVYFHHPPYSTGVHGSTIALRWPFESWGADVVLSGHEHSYERLNAGGFPYLVNGASGANLRDFPNIGTLPPEVESVVRYGDEHGAMLVEANPIYMHFQFVNVLDEIIDQHTLVNHCSGNENDVYLPLIKNNLQP